MKNMKEPLPKNVLFVCTGNTCRSPMAQALYNAIAEEKKLDTSAQSAGVDAYEGMPASIGAVGAMEKYSIDISLHCATQVRQSMLEQADVVLAMNGGQARALCRMFPGQADKVTTLSEYAFGSYEPVDDPFGGDAAAYEACASELLGAIKQILM